MFRKVEFLLYFIFYFVVYVFVEFREVVIDFVEKVCYYNRINCLKSNLKMYSRNFFLFFVLFKS